MKKKSRWKYYDKKQKRNQALQKREATDTKSKEAEKDFVAYYYFNGLWLIAIYQNV